MKKIFTLFLTTCGFNFKIKFLDSSSLQTRRLYLRTFQKKYKYFLLKKRPSKLHCHITFMEPTPKNLFFFKIGAQKLTSIYETTSSKNASIFYHISDHQIDLVFVDILKRLLIEKGDFILHASTILANNKAYLFTGKSGIGKSTIASIFLGTYTCIGDDLICIRKDKSRYVAYSLPLKTKIKKTAVTPGGYEITAVYFLKQSKNCTITKERSGDKVLDNLLPQVILQKKHRNKIIHNVLNFIKGIRHYTYYFSLNRDKVLSVFKMHSLEHNTN